MKQPNIESRKEYQDIMDDAATMVRIPGTKKSYRIHWLKPYTIERMTKVWLERDLAAAKIREGHEVLRDLAIEPYFSFKEAALIILNHDIKIRLFYGLFWRYLAHKYNEEQIVEVVEEGKKKLPLMAHYRAIVSLLATRTDLMKMTKKEAEQYQAELLLVAKQLSSRTSRPTADRVGGYSDGSAPSATDAS